MWSKYYVVSVVFACPEPAWSFKLKGELKVSTRSGVHTCSESTINAVRVTTNTMLQRETLAFACSNVCSTKHMSGISIHV
ncbi:hypothetical protein PF002_g1346 [Phytophthora fragariae]|uniref:Uncharacterized protein n=1 Tax=Phytophthora fragariae TaxID=53985 RepID=A0A6A4AIU0_9STRA|nr:hypothetical protein PF003_g1395 [Phytophthora fragariae]KAE9257073.1 hypothetical protein PF002_g1346 [Phytophthora fragariae]